MFVSFNEFDTTFVDIEAIPFTKMLSDFGFVIEDGMYVNDNIDTSQEITLDYIGNGDDDIDWAFGKFEEKFCNMLMAKYPNLNPAITTDVNYELDAMKFTIEIFNADDTDCQIMFLDKSQD